MSRVLRVAGAQLGPIAREDSRAAVVARLVALLRKAHSFGAQLVVYPELALTTFFPRWVLDDPAQAEAFFEPSMPNPEVQLLFDEARRLGIGFYLGYAESILEDGQRHHYNSAVLVDGGGAILGKYRKVHVPGVKVRDAEGCATNFEKRYFQNGNLGFPVYRAFGGVLGMAICNDRRWPETYRAMSLQGAEMILIGYNTTAHRPVMVGNRRMLEPSHLTTMQHLLVLQSGAYQNCCWVVAAGKGGREEGAEAIGTSCIVAPTGDVVAMSTSLDDEVIVADCDLSAGDYNRASMFNFALNRRIEHYGVITAQRGVEVAV